MSHAEEAEGAAGLVKPGACGQKKPRFSAHMWEEKGETPGSGRGSGQPQHSPACRGAGVPVCCGIHSTPLGKCAAVRRAA